MMLVTPTLENTMWLFNYIIAGFRLNKGDACEPNSREHYVTV